MKRGFTILEMLVASLLLGMMVTVLTMIFSQSSIAWRTGIAGVVDMDVVRDNISAVRDEADNIYLWNGEIHRIVSIWSTVSASGGRVQLRGRSIDSSDNSEIAAYERVQILAGEGGLSKAKPTPKDVFGPKSVSQGNVQPGKNWIVNVKSAGPNGILDDYDDVWSMPDDFE